MRIQLWSYNYDPEPTGIGPVSTTLARALVARGHSVDVVAAHPHYPEPRWGRALKPYREVRDGIPVLRLPLWIGRASAAERYRQELTFTAALTAVTPALGRPQAIIAASPSFPALLPAILNTRARRIPWVLWLHDLLPDGAMATGLIDEAGTAVRLARRLERAAYRAADRIVVLSRAFTTNLEAKGVPSEKITLIYDPATRTPIDDAASDHDAPSHLRILSMGNIGFSQGLAPLVRAFETCTNLPKETELVITGTGVAADDVRNEIITDRVRMLGLVDNARLEAELRAAHVAFVSQQHDGSEFNIPSKLMNFMTYGLPVLAAVNPESEVASLVNESGGGWVVDSGTPEAFPFEVARIAAAPDEVLSRSIAARGFAEAQFSQEAFAARFDEVLAQVARAKGRADG